MDHCDYPSNSVAPWHDYHRCLRGTITHSFGYSHCGDLNKNHSREKSSLDGRNLNCSDKIQRAPCKGVIWMAISYRGNILKKATIIMLVLLLLLVPVLAAGQENNQENDNGLEVEVELEIGNDEEGEEPGSFPFNTSNPFFWIVVILLLIIILLLVFLVGRSSRASGRRE